MVGDEPNSILNKSNMNSDSTNDHQSSNSVEQTVQQSNSEFSTNAGVIQDAHIGHNYNYQNDPETVRRIVKEELKSPQLEYFRLVREGLNILAEAVAIPEIRDAVIAFRTDFEAACEQTYILSSYKDLHDQLHRLEFECYRDIILEVKRFPNDETALEILAEHGLTLQSIIHQLDAIVSQRILITQESVWIQELEQAHTEFQNALHEENAEHLKQSIRLLSRILALQPSRINTYLNAAARALRLPSLSAAMANISQHLNSSSLSIDRVSQFRQGLDALDKLETRLMSLVIIHDSWQVIDVELRQLEISLNYGIDDLTTSWFYLRNRVSLICDGDTDSWSVGFHEDSENLESAIAAAQSSKDVRRYFRLYRRRASERFYQIDQALKRLCDELRTVGEPLASVLRTIT
jgi:hypothetical protein